MSTTFLASGMLDVDLARLGNGDLEYIDRQIDRYEPFKMPKSLVTVEFEVEGHKMATNNALVLVSSVVSSLCNGRPIAGFNTLRDVVNKIQTYSFDALRVVWDYASSGHVQTNAIRSHVVNQKHPSSFDEIFIAECASLAHLLNIPRLVSILRLEMNREFSDLAYSEDLLLTLSTTKAELALTYILSQQSLGTGDRADAIETITSAATMFPDIYAGLRAFFNGGDGEARHAKWSKYSELKQIINPRHLKGTGWDPVLGAWVSPVLRATRPENRPYVSCRMNLPTDRASHLYKHNTANLQQEIPELNIAAATVAGQPSAAGGDVNDAQPDDAAADDLQVTSSVPSTLNLAQIARAAVERVNGVSEVVAPPVYNTRSRARTQVPSGQAAVPTTCAAPPNPPKKRNKKVEATGTEPGDTKESAAPVKKRNKKVKATGTEPGDTKESAAPVKKRNEVQQGSKASRAKKTGA